MLYYRLFKIILAVLIISAFQLAAQIAMAQGNISGTVTNIDESTPANGDMSFFGYLDDSDEEIRIETSTGAGYDIGHWFDDFQNYLTEAAGDPFDFYFYNMANGEGHILSATIEVGSFQEEDIILEAISWPSSPTGLAGTATPEPAIELSWNAISGMTYHIYRRDATSDGSFFRIDDPSGTLTNPGVEISPYVDNTVDGISLYDYLIIAEDASGNMGPHSEIITLSSESAGYICGDVDNDGTINILDIVYLIEYKYKNGPAPQYPESAEVNGDGSINILDIVYLIEFKYKGGPPPDCAD